MLKIYKKSGKVHQEIPIDESIKKRSINDQGRCT